MKRCIAIMVFLLTLALSAGVAAPLTESEYADMALQVNELITTGRYAEALSLLEKMREYKPGEAATAQSSGIVYYYMGDYNKAELYLLEAKAILEKTLGREHPNYAASLSSLGSLYHATGDYPKAEVSFFEAKAILEKVLGREHPDYATSLRGLGSLYQDMGEYARAEACLLEAKAIYEKVLGRDHPDYAASLRGLGAMYEAMGDYARAEPYLLEAKAILEKVMGREHPAYAESLNDLGSLYRNMGDYARAEACLLEAMNIYKKTLCGDNPNYAASLNNLGSLYHDMGDYARAEPYLLEAKAIYEKALGREHPAYAASVNSLGSLYHDMGNYAKAEACYLEAKSIREKTLGRKHPDYAASVNSLSILYQSMGDYTRAAVLNETVIELTINQINQNFSFLSEQQRRSYWDMQSSIFEGSYSLSYFHPTAASSKLNYNNTLFSKGLLLHTTSTVRDSIYSSGNRDLIDRFEELGRLRNEISRLQQNGINQEDIKKLETRAEELDKSLSRDSAAFRELNAGMTVQWQNVRDHLKAGEAAIEFVSFRVYDKKWTNQIRYAALILRPGMEAPLWVPLCEETTLIGLLEKTRGKEPAEQVRILYDDLGAELYAALWQPLEKELVGVKTVFYASAGFLHGMAFTAVPVTADKKIRLGDKYDLNLVSSTRELVRERNETVPASAAIYGGLGYGVKSGDARWNYLPGTLTEAVIIERQLNERKIKSTRYSGNEGNEESFKNLDGSKTSVIHLATYGFFLEGGGTNGENLSSRIGLLFSGANNALSGNPVEGIEDGILTADEIARLNLTGTGLAVFSGCLSGLGSGQVVIELQRAFKLAGVETFVMSLWEVSDRATSELMTVFYRQWLGGKTKQEAFREAQRLVREKYPEPYYWAAFVMMD